MSMRNELIADLLMGAAFADSRLDGREYEAVKALLAGVMGLDAIPEEMEKRLKAFEPKTFDPEGAAASLMLTEEAEKRHLIELIAAVNDADDELDLDEHDYLTRVADAVGLAREGYDDLTMEVLSVENLQEAGKELLAPPPPPPPKD
jgi:uncharacterized tellurite resistance protein B-like protein